MTTNYQNGIQCLFAIIVIVYDICIHTGHGCNRILVIQVLPGISDISLAT